MAKRQRSVSTPGVDGLSEAATIGDVKRFLVCLIQRVDRGRITVKKANCMGQLCNVLVNAILDHELEQRLAELEASHAAGWRPSESRTMTIRAGGLHETKQKPSGTA